MVSEESTEHSSLKLHWKIGVEIELLAPPGVTREDLAAAVAAEHGGTVRVVLHQDSEPSAVSGQPVFYNLTLGFEAFDAESRLLVRCVDDLTLQHDLNRQAQPRQGWWLILSDDERLLRLIALHTDPSLPLPDALSKLAPMFNSQLLDAPGGVFRLVDSVGAPLALAAPLPGERERPCELITPPLDEDHARKIEVLLATATGGVAAIDDPLQCQRTSRRTADGFTASGFNPLTNRNFCSSGIYDKRSVDHPDHPRRDCWHVPLGTLAP